MAVFSCDIAAELAARSSQHDVMTRELDHLRRQTVDLQMETERTSAQLAKVANECDVARATTQRLTGQLEDVERRKRELEVELARARGSRDVDVYERRRIEAETSRDQEKFSEILKEVETLQVRLLLLVLLRSAACLFGYRCYTLHFFLRKMFVHNIAA